MNGPGKETFFKGVVKTKERFEFSGLENVTRIMDKMGFKNGFDFSNLNKNEKIYTKDEIRAMKSHYLIESKQEVTWKDNNDGTFFKTEITNVNTVTHNESVESIRLGSDINNNPLYLNNINLKFCNIKDRLYYKNINVEENKKIILDNRDTFIKNTDDRMTKWFDCMKTMKNNVNNCYDVIFWKSNNLNKVEFFINNNIDLVRILDTIEIVSTLK